MFVRDDKRNFWKNYQRKWEMKTLMVPKHFFYGSFYQLFKKGPIKYVYIVQSISHKLMFYTLVVFITIIDFPAILNSCAFHLFSIYNQYI